MSDPKEVVRKAVIDFWTEGKREMIPEIYDPGYRRNDTWAPGITGHAGIGELFDKYREGVPDLRFKIEDMLVEGQKVTVRYWMQGTHKGKLMNMKATNREFTVEGIGIFKVVNGLVAEDWHNYDMLTFLQMLDAIPSLHDVLQDQHEDD